MATAAVATAPGPPTGLDGNHVVFNEKTHVGLNGMNGHNHTHGQLNEKANHAMSKPEPTSSSLPPSPTTPVAPATYAQPQPSSPLRSSHQPTAHAGPSKPTLPSSSCAHSPPHLLSTHLLAHPGDTGRRAIHTQFPKSNPLSRLLRRFRVKHSVIKGMTEKEWKKFEKMAPDLRRKAGWKAVGAADSEEGVEVSELFWKMYMSLLPTLERDPLSGLVPPDLLGSTTTMPLTVISLIPDIMQHYHDVIVRAREEVFLATNYWQPSNSVTTITGSLIELSNLVIKEGRKKIVVKIMYDRGSLEQLYNSHAPVASEKWKPLDLPGPEDIPGLEMEVINFHRVLLGTFHAKFLVVDRKVALINSNNIQDRPNLELMSHLEGPIVDSFYEVALHSWYNALSPPLPCMSKPYQPPLNSSGKPTYLFSHDNPFLDDIEVLKAAKAARLLLRKQTQDLDAENARLRGEDNIPAADKLRDAVKRVMEQQRQSLADWRPGERFDESVQNAMHELREMRERWTGGVGAVGGGGGKSRPGSRGPSRRTSANEGMFRSLWGEKSDYTIAHAPLTAPDPSEAPSSPTIAETPIKAKSYPQPGRLSIDIDSDHGYPSPSPIPDTADSSKRNQNQPHVAFAPLSTTVDGTGKFMPSDTELPHPQGNGNGNVSGNGDRPTTAALTIPGSRFVERLSTSPVPSSIHVPSAPPGSPVSATHGSIPPVSTSAAQQSSSHGNGESLPPSAMTPQELAAAGITGTSGMHQHQHLNGDNDDDQVDRATIDDRAGEGRDGLVIMESVIPEGHGSSRRLYKMSKMFNAAGVLSEAWATVEDSDDLDTFQPHVVHDPHDPVPVAMTCRKPHGFPGHHDIRNPQNAAWLAGFRYAKKSVFVQTPTLNARPIVRAVKQACRRGVQVSLLLDLGFNDKGESIPFQGGTNEEVVVRLYKALRKEKKEQYLKVYWYTGKDQVRPLNAVKKQRNCHIKFAAYDDEVLIIGNGNQDSQSWFHSQEVNVMVDSKQIVKEMMDTLLTNQNTIQYGLVDTDGIWRDKEGKTLKDYGATEGGKFRGLSGFIAFAKTI